MAGARGSGLLIAALLGAALLIPLVQGRIDAYGDKSTIDPDILYFSSPRIVKALALGYDDLVADVYWMRAIQYYGRREEAARRRVPYKNLFALLDIVTTLDPKMLDVYRAGKTFLAEPEPLGAGKPLDSVRLLDKGIALLPQEWSFRYEKGFVYYLYLKDFRLAGQAWLEAARVPGAPPWMEGLAATSLSRGGDIETARNLWRRQMHESPRADLRENARNHLVSIETDERIWTLEFWLGKYAAARGAYPQKLQDLLTPGSSTDAIKDPSGVPFDYYAPTGTVSLSGSSKIRYVPLSYDYRKTYQEKLEREYRSKLR